MTPTPHDQDATETGEMQPQGGQSRRQVLARIAAAAALPAVIATIDGASNPAGALSIPP